MRGPEEAQRSGEGGVLLLVRGGNRCCNVRAESQQIVRQAYSRAYNTPLRDKVVYNVSIFPDGRVVMQGNIERSA